MTKLLTRRGAIIGSVKALALKDNPDRRVDLAQCNLAAYRADRQGIVGEMLKLVKLMTAFLAFITINRHFSLLLQI